MRCMAHLAPCAHSILLRGARHGLMPLAPVADPEAAHWAHGTGIRHAYLLHYRGNTARRRYQELQLPSLGINASIVTAYDKQDLDATVYACHALCDPSDAGIFRSRSNQSSICDNVWAARFSASLKLYVALFDMAWRAFPAALILEDDVQIRWAEIASLGRAVRNTSSTAAPADHRLAVLFSSSYSPTGHDSLCCEDGKHHVHLRPENRFGSGLMPAVGVVVTARGA